MNDKPAYWHHSGWEKKCEICREGTSLCEEYEILHGPDGFQMLLTEPEDRWCFRDFSPAVDELNRLTRERDDALRMCRRALGAGRKCQDPASSTSLMGAEDVLDEVETYLRDPGALDEEPHRE